MSEHNCVTDEEVFELTKNASKLLLVALCDGLDRENGGEHVCPNCLAVSTVLACARLLKMVSWAIEEDETDLAHRVRVLMSRIEDPLAQNAAGGEA